MSQSNTQKSKSSMTVKYGAIGTLLMVAPVVLVTEIIMPMLAVQ